MHLLYLVNKYFYPELLEVEYTGIFQNQKNLTGLGQNLLLEGLAMGGVGGGLFCVEKSEKA